MIATLRAFPDFGPVPRVEVRVEDSEQYDGGDAEAPGEESLDGGEASGSGEVVDGGTASTLAFDVPEGADKVTLWRRAGSEGKRLKVRGAVARSFNEGFAYLDLEAPPNAVSLYEAEFFASGDSLGSTPLGSTFLPWGGPEGHVIIQQPLNPRRFALVRNMAGSWPEVTRSAPAALVFNEGAADPSLVGFGPRRSAQGIEVDFEAASRAVADDVWATLGDEAEPQLPVWLIRSPNPGLLPAVFFGYVGELAEVDRTVGRSKGDGSGTSRFRARIDEIAPPAPALSIPTLTYSDLAAVFPTYTELKAALPTYSQMASAWEYAGAAG